MKERANTTKTETYNKLQGFLCASSVGPLRLHALDLTLQGSSQEDDQKLSHGYAYGDSSDDMQVSVKFRFNCIDTALHPNGHTCLSRLWPKPRKIRKDTHYNYQRGILIEQIGVWHEKNQFITTL